MFSKIENGEFALSDEDKARVINIALFLEHYDYDEKFLNMMLFLFSETERRRIYAFWSSLTPATHKAYLCMKEFEEALYEYRTRWR